MGKYVFSLEKVLDWRIDKQEDIRRKVSELEAEKAVEETKLARLVHESAKLKAEQLFGGNVNSMRQHTLYQDLTSQRIIQQKLAIEKVDDRIVQAQAELLEAHKEKRVLEKLKEKNQAAYIKKELDEEQRYLDELSVLHHGRSFI